MSFIVTGSISFGDIALIVTLLLGFGGVYKWTHDYRETWIDRLLDSKKFMTKIEEFVAETLGPSLSNIPAPGNPYTLDEKNNLINKQKNGTLTCEDALRLREILNEDLERAKKNNDIGTIIILVIALLGLVALISAFSKESRPKAPVT